MTLQYFREKFEKMEIRNSQVSVIEEKLIEKFWNMVTEMNKLKNANKIKRSETIGEIVANKETIEEEKSSILQSQNEESAQEIIMTITNSQGVKNGTKRKETKSTSSPSNITNGKRVKKSFVPSSFSLHLLDDFKRGSSQKEGLNSE